MGSWRVLNRCGRTIGHLTVGVFAVTGVLLLLFAFLVSSWEMDGKAEGRWLRTSPCDNEKLFQWGQTHSEPTDGSPRSWYQPARGRESEQYPIICDIRVAIACDIRGWRNFGFNSWTSSYTYPAYHTCFVNDDITSYVQFQYFMPWTIPISVDYCVCNWSGRLSINWSCPGNWFRRLSI